MNKLITHIICAPITLYQWCISPLLGTCCRFTPSCSHYAREAVQLHGARGVWLAFLRVLRCNPLAKHGYDPVPLPSAHLAARPTTQIKE